VADIRIARRGRGVASAAARLAAGRGKVGRDPGVGQVTFRAPVGRLEACGLLDYAVAQYGEVPGAANDGSRRDAGAAATDGDTLPTTDGTGGATPQGA